MLMMRIMASFATRGQAAYASAGKVAQEVRAFVACACVLMRVRVRE